MSKINQLIAESTLTAANSQARPSLLALTRATTNLIYRGLVATQTTSQPVAALYGVKYLNSDKALSFTSGATYSGQHTSADRASMTVMTVANMGSIVKDELFTVSSVVFKAVADAPFGSVTGTTEADAILEASIAGTIRLAPEAASTEKYESSEDISESRFEISLWKAEAKSRKFKTELTTELMQDMEANGLASVDFVQDLLATQMAEEINKDIIQSLITVSTRFKSDGSTATGIFDMSSGGVAFQQARELYRYICEMNAIIQNETAYSATYVVASARVAAVLSSSGWVEPSDEVSEYGVLKNGLVVYVDTTSPLDYVVVGVKASFGEGESVGSLFYAPYVDKVTAANDPVDHIGAYTVINDYMSLQPKVSLLVRYALSVNPYTMGLTDQQAKLVDSTNLDQFVGQSKMSMILGIKLPKIL